MTKFSLFTENWIVLFLVLSSISLNTESLVLLIIHSKLRDSLNSVPLSSNSYKAHTSRLYPYVPNLKTLLLLLTTCTSDLSVIKVSLLFEFI